MVEVSAIATPLVILAVALVMGLILSFVPGKTRARKAIPVVAFGAVIGILGLLAVFMLNDLLSSYVYSVSYFHDFAGIFSGIDIPIIMYNSELVALIVLLAVLEVGLASGFGISVAIQGKRTKTQLVEPKAEVAPQEEAAKTVPHANLAGLVLDQPKNVTAEAPSPDEGLLHDEQTLMELFLYGTVTQIVPVINPSKPEGYSYSGIPRLDWDTKRTTQVLNGLVRKGYLNAELVDKIVLCQTCGSGNVRIIKSCPECGSLSLQKESLIEHYSCGAVERQAAFESKNGDLVCPRCKAKLQQVGSDYRPLPPAYKCLNCNTLNSEPKLLMKCVDCASTTELDDEPELLLYKYTANAHMPPEALQHIKPVNNVTQYFKNLGYTIIAPAFVSGKSGTQHLFDMLVLSRINWVESQHSGNAPTKASGNTAVEVHISGKLISLAEITSIYGKINDIDTGFILFAIPGLTANARSYAKANNIRVSEGKSIEEALVNSKIPKVVDEHKTVGSLSDPSNPISVQPNTGKE